MQASGRGYSIAEARFIQENLGGMALQARFHRGQLSGCAMFLDKWQYTIAEMGKVELPLTGSAEQHGFVPVH